MCIRDRVLVGCGPSVGIHEAAKEGNIKAVKQHLAAGTDVNAMYCDGWTPLHYAVNSRRKEIAELLIANGADVNAKSDWFERTPLHDAIWEVHKEVIELLITKGADVNAKDHRARTPLHIAAQKGHKETVELLIAKGA